MALVRRAEPAKAWAYRPEDRSGGGAGLSAWANQRGSLWRRSRGQLQLELVQAFAVVGERHQAPLPRDLALAAQGEVGEAEDRLDDAEDRLDGLLAALVEGAALLAGELGRHGLQPFGLGFLGRGRGL